VYCSSSRFQFPHLVAEKLIAAAQPRWLVTRHVDRKRLAASQQTLFALDFAAANSSGSVSRRRAHSRTAASKNTYLNR
jgi:hypothetical protein